MTELSSFFCDSSALCLWPPNWSQFVPDVLVALITGTAIGFALDMVQKRRTKRDQVDNAQRSWDRLQSSLRSSFETDPEVHVDRWLDKGKLESISVQIQGHPIQAWSRLLQDEALSSLVRLEHNATRLLQRERLLQEGMKVAVISLRPDTIPKSNLSERHHEAERAVRAIALGLNVSDARIRLRENVSDETLIQWAEAVCRDERMVGLLQQFHEARRRTLSDYAKIASAFEGADRVSP